MQPAVVQPKTDANAAQAPAGSWLTQGNQFLSGALDAWAKVEQIKATRASTGGDQVQRQTQPELANGAGVILNTTAQDREEQRKAGVTPFGEINKTFLGFAVGALVLGLALKAKGFK